jgi:PAS domain S-box-containing protein
MKISGFTAEELGRMQVRDWFGGNETEAERGMESAQKALREGSADTEAHLIMKNGTAVPFYLTGQRFVIEDHVFFTGVGIDLTERKRAEEALKKSEEQMRLFFERQLVGMAITSTEKGWLQVNDRLCRMLGYSRDELFHLTWAELTYPDDLAPDVAQFNRLLAGEIDEYSMEKRFIRKDGTIVYTNLSIGCVRKADGSVDYVLALLEDITERKRSEEALRESEERYKNFVEKSFAGVYVVQDGIFVFLNNSATSSTGYKPEELIGKQSDCIVHPEDKEKIREKAKKMLSGDDLSPYEFRIVTKDGNIRWIMETVTSIQYSGGKAILGNSMDITDRKQAEEALKESEERYRAIFENTGTASVIIEDDTTISLANTEFVNLTGYSREEIEGKKTGRSLLFKKIWNGCLSNMSCAG